MPKVENFTQIFPSTKPTTLGLLICNLISEIKVLKNQGLLQTKAKFQVLQTWILFRLPPRKKLDLYHKPEKIKVTN